MRIITDRYAAPGRIYGMPFNPFDAAGHVNPAKQKHIEENRLRKEYGVNDVKMIRKVRRKERKKCASEVSQALREIFQTGRPMADVQRDLDRLTAHLDAVATGTRTDLWP